MKVNELKKGMVLRVSDSERLGWITEKHPIVRGEPEMRFIYEFMSALVPGKVIPRGELIIYLGHDKVPVDDNDPNYKKIVRRIMVGEKTAVVLGYNFKYLEPHPEFS